MKPPHKAAAEWTRPRETPGQLEFAVYGNYLADPRMKRGWSAARWLEHPRGIEGASSIGIVVRDMAKTKRRYCDVLNGGLLHEESIAAASGVSPPAYLRASFFATPAITDG